MGAALEYVNRHDCHGAGRIEHGRQEAGALTIFVKHVC
jgi:hypothetical protein